MRQTPTKGIARLRPTTNGQPHPVHWYTVPVAAEILSLPAVTLRRRIQRYARRTPDGTVSTFDGITARKIGGQWRVWLGNWAMETATAPPGTVGARKAAEHGGEES